MKADVQKKRIDSIDFWRGVVLAVILVNHIPGNVLGAFTPRNFNFSDAAEVFVFLSGVSVQLAYGEKFRRSPGVAAAASLVRRAARLYGAHLMLTAAALALFWVAKDYTPYDLLLSERGRATPFLDPARGVVGILALSHQVAYFNILPLYIVLMAAAPLLLALTLRGRFAMLAASVALYAGARMAGVNLPSWPEPGGWYFNPFTWQLMFALGIFCGGALQDKGVPYHPVAYHFSVAFTFIGAMVVSNVLGLAPGLVEEAGLYLDWDKTDLGVVRIIDFLTLAYMIHFSNLTARIRATRAFSFFSLMGRNALPIFCVGSLMSAVGQMLRDSSLASPVLDVLYVGASLALLHRLAGHIDRDRPVLLLPYSQPAE
ncbi:OpgC family protein [Methylocystis sp. ATCC 49242]|uniref:OpgC family protein n=1 Tax=Methylocystis sp. ATCC 49242 TaxID=622637 RepID=UPI0001F8713C|nr:OpgC domain-containing protein [Methylocystis sp. ATCC 49242]